jgi:hypothetical protein
VKRWLVVLDISYYPEVVVVEAASVDEAIGAAGFEEVGDRDGACVVYVAPMECVEVRR